MTLYERLEAAGVRTANHESDLYFESTERSRAVLAAWLEELEGEVRVETFWNPVERATWIEVAFAYDPWWAARAPREVAPC